MNADEAVKLVEDIGNHWFSAYCHIELGNVHRTMGHYTEAERHYRQSLRIKKDYKDPEETADLDFVKDIQVIKDAEESREFEVFIG